MIGYVNIGVILTFFIGILLTRTSALSVKEEEDAGTFVGTVDGVDDDYKLTSTQYFTLTSGNELRTKVKIDRETLPNDIIKLTAVSEVSREAPVEIEVTILDINDNSPTFREPTLILNLTETTSPNSKSVLPFAEDIDAGENAEIRSYEIVSGNRDLFQLSLESALYLKLLRPLDREDEHRHELRISAGDGGNPKRFGFLDVVVNVLDINDNPPKFPEEYNYEFSEDVTVGKTLFTVKANDLDQGVNGKVTYAIGSQTDPGTFIINSTTGDIVLVKPLDYEKTKKHQLHILATDGGTPPMTDGRFVFIEVTNVNDNDPVITFRYLSSHASVASIEENESVGTFIALVSVTDPDMKQINNDIRMEVVEGNELEYFSFTRVKNSKTLATIEVANNRSLSRQSYYNLTIRADDPDPTSDRFTLASMLIFVNTGENNPPVFDQKRYNVTLSETAPIGSVAVVVHATDDDIGLNGRLSYKISQGNDLGWFDIDVDTGLISTSKTLHFEQISNNGTLKLVVIAEDQTKKALSDNATVQITIWDENDNSPTFSASRYNFNITENAVGIIGEIKAADNDHGRNGEIYYKLESATSTGNDPWNVKEFQTSFMIGEDGTVTVTEGLDREFLSTYSLRVSATDKGIIPRKTVTDVIVNVIDTNDNSPVVYPRLYFAAINPSSVGKVFTRVMASDADSIDIDRLSFKISSKSSYYSINGKTGELSLNQEVPGREGTKDTIVVYVVDSDGNISDQNATVSVFINSKPNTEKVFNRESYEFYVLESSKNDYFLGVIDLADAHISVTMHITNGNYDSAFRIDTTEGYLYISNSSLIDAEKTTIRNLTIVAEINDPIAGLRFASMICLVHIIDVNDNTPQFVSLLETASKISDHSYSDSCKVMLNGKFEKVAVYNSEAKDYDISTRDQNLAYGIFTSYEGFEIDPKNGMLYHTQMQDTNSFENDTAQVEIVACDEEPGKKCASLHLTVSLLFVDVIISNYLPNSHVRVKDNVAVGTQVAKITELNDKFGIFRSAKLGYEINPRTPFRVYPRGEIIVSQELDFEKSPGLEIESTTSIQSGEDFWQKRNWLVAVVEDVNDNIPIPVDKHLQFSIKESAKAGHFVGNVVADDADSGVYGSLVYEIQRSDNAGSNLFYCDRFTGDLFLSQTPNRKFLPFHGLYRGEVNLTIIVSDQNGKNSPTSIRKVNTVQVQIKIEMENRSRLSFSSRIYYKEIPENSLPSNVLKVTASDTDALWEVDPPAVLYGLYEYDTRNQSKYFKIHRETGVVGAKGMLLDREEREIHHLVVEAKYKDGSEYAFANLYLRILDVKDSAPVFTQKSYHFTVSQTSLTVSPIGRVEARDGDIVTDDSRIYYRFESDSQEIFDIDDNSGYIFLTQPIENDFRHHTSVIAKDESDEEAKVSVLIEVVNSGDGIPAISYSTNLNLAEEFYDKPKVITTPAISDSDNENPTIQYTLVSPTGIGKAGAPKFQVDPILGSVTVSGNVDYEASKEYKLIIRAYNIVTSRSKDFDILVRILDRNDNAPVFTSRSSYILPRVSGSRVGEVITRISATDEDDGLNGKVSITIANPSNADFNINGVGDLTVRSAIDPSQVIHPVQLIATDKGSPPKSTRKTIHIIFMSDADISKMSVPSLPKVHLPETKPQGTVVTTVPHGLTQNSDIQYFLGKVSFGDSERNERFFIDSNSGEIKTSTDMEGFDGTYQLHLITVGEESLGGPAAISTRTVTVEITDENNNPPEFGSATQRIPVLESEQPGKIVATITADDPDENDVITYSLSSKTGDLGTDFIIDEKTAAISVGPGGLDREKVAEYQLEVTADDGIHRSSTELLIHIEDVNDNPPEFLSSPICFDLRENSPIKSLVGRLETRDADLNSMVQYSLIDEDESHPLNFSVHETYGTIIYEGEGDIDREEKDLYVLHVRATDQGGFYSDVRVYIYITDENDNEPELSIYGSKEFGISEQTPVGSDVAKIKSTDADLGLNKEIYYSIVSGDPDRHFWISSYSGQIRTNAKLDRETKDRYDLTIMGRNKFSGHGFEQYSNISISITLLDENDNRPSFATDLISYVDEAAANGQFVLGIKAIDPDLRDDGRVLYSLLTQIPDDGIFAIDEKSGNLTVADNRNLDYELRKMYNLTVEAKDKSHDELKTTINIVVHVMDANDHRPAFLQTKYIAPMEENAAIGTHIIKVGAEDADEEFNSQIQFRIVPSYNASFFYIDRYTGDVSLFNSLDYEKQTEITIEIEAIDGGVSPLSAYCTLVVNVEDVNDCSPVIFPNHIILHVMENSYNSASALTKFYAFDEDSGNNGVVDFSSSVSVEPATNAFTLNIGLKGSASLALRQSLDRERAEQYYLTITAGDRGSFPRRTTASVLIIVDNKNEFPPEFGQFEYFAEISEDASPGSLTTIVKATDADGSNIWYEILEESEDIPFYVDQSTGNVFLQGYLDREKKSRYNITVTAYDDKDASGVRFRSDVSLIINVTDVNDNRPKFSDDARVVFVDSVNSVGTIAVFDAHDPDYSENGRVFYSIANPNPSFTIDKNTGEIRCTAALSSAHNLTIRATDNGIEPLFSAMNVEVYLTNNRVPAISHDISSTLSIKEDISKDTLIGTFQATTSRGNIGYFLHGDRYGWFTLDSSSGQLRVNKNMDRELSSEITLWVEAKDTGTPSLSSYSKITIQIEDVNDNRPRFTNQIFTVHVKEDEIKTLSQLSTFDPDSGVNGDVSLSIVEYLSEDSDKFELVSDGRISNTQNLDRETKSMYTLVIRAADGGSPSLHSDVIFHVIVDDVNENSPKFEHLFSATIPEDAPVGDFVLKASSTDEDEFSEHIYKLIENPGEYFSIDKDGIITVAKELDREVTNLHRLQVQASDGRSSISSYVTIRISDVNDNSPRFDKSKYKAAVSVDASIGTIVAEVNATDLDIEYNGMVHYKISGDNMYFDINVLGKIRTLQELQCLKGLEGCPVEHVISIVACDSGLVSMNCGSTDVVISIRSVNTNTPQFTNDNEKIAVEIVTPIGNEILGLTATDEDPGTELTYSILPGNHASYFSLVHGSSLILQKSLDTFTIGNTLNIKVQVTDNGVPARSAIAHFNVEVTGENLHSPSFSQSSYVASPILEDSVIGTKVIEVEAHDADSGLNGEITFDLIKGNRDGKFRINRQTGIITVAGELDYEKVKSYDLIVAAFDSAMIPQNQTVSVTIPVQDVNDNVPFFNSSEFEMRIFESTPVGQTIARLNALDMDSGANAVIKYSIVTQSVVDTEGNGNIYLSGAINYENPADRHHFTKILAENPGVSERRHAWIEVIVLGSNEFSPKFLSKSYEYHIPYQSGYGAKVGVINATDQDEGDDGLIEYLLIPNRQSVNFHLNQETGEILVLDASPYKVGDNVTLNVVAKNPTTSSESCLFDETMVIVRIISNECYKDPCKNGATCEDGTSNFKCYCLPGYTDVDCGTNIDECAPDPCTHGTCSDGVNSYQCTCDQGYTGVNCDVEIDYCEQSPCLNGGICKSGTSNFTCECPFGAKGERCEIQSLNFPLQSYIVVGAVKNHISFEFSTVSSNALLFYSNLSSSKYAILEILNGQLQLKMTTNNNNIQLNLSKNVIDGLWHTVSISLQGSDLSIIIDDCFSELENECSSSAKVSSGLDFTSADLVIGGITDVAVLNEGKLSSHDFVGCIRSLSFDSKTITSSTSAHIVQKHLIGDGCVKTSLESLCSTNQCKNEATCTDLWSQAQCTCPAGWQGPRCESKMDGQTFTGKGFADISFTESYIRDVILESSFSDPSRTKRSVSKTESSVEIRFRTKNEKGVLIMTDGTDDTHFGILYLTTGIVKYAHQGRTGLVTLTSQVNASDGNWHTAKVTIIKIDEQNAEITLFLDSEKSSSTTRTFTTLPYDADVITDFENPLAVKNLYIGGVPQLARRDLPTTDFFKGCVFHFKLNGTIQQLRSDVVHSDLLVRADDTAIAQSCNGTGLACSLVTCENGRDCVPDDVRVSQCICSDGYVEDGDTCAVAAVGGFDWWIIIIVIAVVAVIAVAAFLFVRRRRQKSKQIDDMTVENGVATIESNCQASEKTPTPDLTPYDPGALTDDSERPIMSTSSCDEAPNNTFSSQVTLIPMNGIVQNGSSDYSRQVYALPRENGSGRKSTNDILKLENLSNLDKRPASAQANLAPDVASQSSERSDNNGSKLYTPTSRTLPRKAPNKSLSYIMDHPDGPPRRPSSRGKAYTGSRSATERRRQKRKSREVETLEIMMKEISGIAGFTPEEMDLLHAGALALQKNNPEILYEDASTTSTSSATDSSTRSNNTNSSRRIRTPKSLTPQMEILKRHGAPSPGVIKQQDLKVPTEKYVSLSPFNFPSPMFESDTEDPNSTSQDDDTWESITSDETASTTTKQDVFSSGTMSSQLNQLDLNFPSNLGEYFSSLTNVFDDISQLKSDKSIRMFPSEDPSRRPSVLPGFVSNEVSLWNEIEALSKKPLKRTPRKSSFEHSSSPSPLTGNSEGRLTPVRKTGSRMNSPMFHDIIEEETLSSRHASPIDLLENVEDESDNNTKRTNISRSSSGRSNKSTKKMKPEFVKFV